MKYAASIAAVASLSMIVPAVRAAPASAGSLLEILPPELTQCAPAPAAQPGAVERQSLYVPAQDGVRLAVDVVRPKSAGDAKLPTVFMATRYFRSGKGAPPTAEEQFWTSRGYAVVEMDLRGTGASFGQWYIPYAPQEARDIGDVARWVAAQPWSNGDLVSTGLSYTATTSLVAPAFGAPAIKASIARYPDHDQYRDLLWPGGVPTKSLIAFWGGLVRQMDENRLSGDFAAMAPQGVRPVDGADGEGLLAAAVADHRRNPVGFDQAADQVTYVDDVFPAGGALRIADGMAFVDKARIDAKALPILSWASWLDTGTAQGTLARFKTWKAPQISIIGAWSHGGEHDADPFHTARPPVTPTVEAQKQIDVCYAARLGRNAKGAPLKSAIYYYTLGEGRWKVTDRWPVAGVTTSRFFLGEGRNLAAHVPKVVDVDTYKVDAEASTGTATRWLAMYGPSYPDRSAQDAKLLTYTGDPLAADTEVTGQPSLTLELSVNQTDGAVFVYLEDVAPDGRVTYVTEGQLRLLHRAVSTPPAVYAGQGPYHSYARRDGRPMVPGQVVTVQIALQPTSALFRAGHRIRLAIAGADKDTFPAIPQVPKGDVVLSIQRGGARASHLDLPIAPR
ncbi:CocE/NonD family hydrolase [soil metagenome]